ncbi:MAG TPA: hypothetical protein VIF62_35470 [Labilithrix sp.]
MPAETFEITYAAHTASCTFLLDAEGICRRIVMAPHVKRKESQTAARCVGAQYVASLDALAAGCMVEMPRVGAAMLFARVDERGRVSLVRTGPCSGFEQAPAENPFESVSMKTSAPEITPRTQPPRTQPSHDHDPDYFDADDRTVRIQAVRPEDLVSLSNEAGDLATAEYTAPPPRHPASSEVRESKQRPAASAPPRSPDALPTLRNPRHDGLDEEENPYARAIQSARGMLPPMSSSGRRGGSRR